jgi:hypothetical protein
MELRSYCLRRIAEKEKSTLRNFKLTHYRPSRRRAAFHQKGIPVPGFSKGPFASASLENWVEEPSMDFGEGGSLPRRRRGGEEDRITAERRGAA